jgi:hypothetical protein
MLAAIRQAVSMQFPLEEACNWTPVSATSPRLWYDPRAGLLSLREFPAKDPKMSARVPLLPEAADSLALAVITSSSTPVLLLDDMLAVIAAAGITHVRRPASERERP